MVSCIGITLLNLILAGRRAIDNTQGFLLSRIRTALAGHPPSTETRNNTTEGPSPESNEFPSSSHSDKAPPKDKKRETS